MPSAATRSTCFASQTPFSYLPSLVYTWAFTHTFCDCLQFKHATHTPWVSQEFRRDVRHHQPTLYRRCRYRCPCCSTHTTRRRGDDGSKTVVRLSAGSRRMHLKGPTTIALLKPAPSPSRNHQLAVGSLAIDRCARTHTHTQAAVERHSLRACLSRGDRASR